MNIILLVVILNNGVPETMAQEFNSLQQCQTAEKFITWHIQYAKIICITK